jgi:hypothetical protein
MFFSIVNWIIISLTLIFLIHHLYLFLMNTLTVPKIKDLVNKPTQQYKEIFDTLEQAKNVRTVKRETTKGPILGSSVSGPNTSDSPLSMSDELSAFLSELKKAPVSNISGVSDINSLPNLTDKGVSLGLGKY